MTSTEIPTDNTEFDNENSKLSHPDEEQGKNVLSYHCYKSANTTRQKKINNIHNDKKKMELINNHNKIEEKFNIRKIAFLYNSNE